MRTYRHIETGSIVCITDDRSMSEEYEVFDITQVLAESSNAGGATTVVDESVKKPRTTRKRTTRKKAE